MFLAVPAVASLQIISPLRSSSLASKVPFVLQPYSVYHVPLDWYSSANQDSSPLAIDKRQPDHQQQLRVGCAAAAVAAAAVVVTAGMVLFSLFCLLLSSVHSSDRPTVVCVRQAVARQGWLARQGAPLIQTNPQELLAQLYALTLSLRRTDPPTPVPSFPPAFPLAAFFHFTIVTTASVLL